MVAVIHEAMLQAGFATAGGSSASRRPTFQANVSAHSACDFWHSSVPNCALPLAFEIDLCSLMMNKPLHATGWLCHGRGILSVQADSWASHAGGQPFRPMSGYLHSACDVWHSLRLHLRCATHICSAQQLLYHVSTNPPGVHYCIATTTYIIAYGLNATWKQYCTVSFPAHSLVVHSAMHLHSKRVYNTCVMPV